MNELMTNLESEIALMRKHLEEDKARMSDPILGQFFRGRVAVEDNMMNVLNKLFDISQRL